MIDEVTLALPNYDGNGMHPFMGNASETGRVALRFIDFAQQRRLRVEGTAELQADHPLLTHFPGAQFMLVVHVARAYPNCGRYIHAMQRVALSPYVPDVDGHAPIPGWKQTDWACDVLPATAGGLPDITNSSTAGRRRRCTLPGVVGRSSAESHTSALLLTRGVVSRPRAPSESAAAPTKW